MSLVLAPSVCPGTGRGCGPSLRPGRAGELLDIVLPALRADLRLAGALPVPGTVRAPLLAFAGDDDVSAPPEEVARWADHTTSWWGMTVMPGGHFFVADHITAVVDAVSRGLGTGGSGYDEELLRT